MLTAATFTEAARARAAAIDAARAAGLDWPAAIAAGYAAWLAVTEEARQTPDERPAYIGPRIVTQECSN